MIYKAQQQESYKKKDLREVESGANYSSLPKGYLFCGRYEVVKGLEKGSGGCVYLVNDLSVIMPKSREECKSETQKRSVEQSSLRRSKVLKIFRGI